MSTSDEAQLDHLLALSAAFDGDLAKLIGKCMQPKSPRTLVSLALCKTALEHAISQRMLLEAGLAGTALALARLHFEAVVRAAWTNQGASETWIEKFTTPGEGAEIREPQMGPPIPAMLDAFEPYAPQIAAELRRLNTTIKAMHSFVHGGAQAVLHSLQPYPAQKLSSVLQNRNLLGVILANIAVIASHDPGLVPRMRLLRERHEGCMPPPTRAGTS